MHALHFYIRLLLLLPILSISACTGASLGPGTGAGIAPAVLPQSSGNAANTSSSGTVSSSTDPGFLGLEDKELLYKGLTLKFEGEKSIQDPQYSSSLVEGSFDSQKNVNTPYAVVKRMLPKKIDHTFGFEETDCGKICQNRYVRIVIYGSSFPFDTKLNLEEDVDLLLSKINKGEFDRGQFSYIDLPIQNDGKVFFQNFKLQKYGVYTFLLLPTDETPVTHLTPLTDEIYNRWMHWEEYRILREGRVIEEGSDKTKPKINFPILEKKDLHSVLSEISSDSYND